MSTSRTAKAARFVVALAVLQGAVVGAWLLLLRRERATPPIGLSRQPPSPLPSLTLLSPRGELSLDEQKGPLLLHFWATWCVPCREELPQLLSVAEDEGIAVIAVSVDENRRALDVFFEHAVPAQVWRVGHVAAREALQVGTLPVTFFVDAGGRIVARTDLAQVWTPEAMRDAVRRALSPP